jgi:hypothetical protein
MEHCWSYFLVSPWKLPCGVMYFCEYSNPGPNRNLTLGPNPDPNYKLITLTLTLLLILYLLRSIFFAMDILVRGKNWIYRLGNKNWLPGRYDVTKMTRFDVRVVCKQPRCQAAWLFRMMNTGGTLSDHSGSKGALGLCAQ